VQKSACAALLSARGPATRPATRMRRRARLSASAVRARPRGARARRSRGARLTGAPPQVITSEIDEGIDEQTYQVVPGARVHYC